MMRTATKIKYLKKARDLISDKNRWCQGVLAKDKSGHPVTETSREAYSFCAIGALGKVCPVTSNWGEDVIHLESILQGNLPWDYTFVARLNDEEKPHTHRRVIGTFNRAIKSLERAL